ncbi:hypothetical protein [Hyphomicrobium denitrificans]|uniref:hypothetical protein n=1 Tax=Hyphomicrobium denitrificans TaxID=53399 RepID=UPI00022E6073|nr:hypothetical protein [Hyphomicrobium denitrificans]
MPAASQSVDLDYVLSKLLWMRDRHIWPNGLRYLWTDAFGVVLFVSLFEATGEDRFLEQAHWLVTEVDRVLGRPRGIRIGEEPDRDGQYFHYLAMWIYALAILARHMPEMKSKGVALVRQIHGAFVLPRRGVIWKMKEDLSGPYPGYGLGALDAFDGYISYSKLDEKNLAGEISDMRALIGQQAPSLWITQDLGIGMMLWMTHFHPDEDWAVLQRQRCLQVLDTMWMPAGYFCREPYLRTVKFAFTNYGASIGLQAVGAMPDRIEALHQFFDRHRSGDEYDEAAITHVMACSAHFPGLLLEHGWQDKSAPSGRL